MDKVLKIYDGSGAHYVGDGDLKYTIQGDLKNYLLTDNSNFELDIFEASIVRRDYDIYTNDVWRLYALDGTLISSGFIEKEPVTSQTGDLNIQGLSWTGILTRRTVESKKYSDTGDNIFKDLLTTYFAAYDVNIFDIETPTNTITNTYNNRTVYEVVKDVMSNSYGAGSKQFDFYLYELMVGTIRALAVERESVAITRTLHSGDIKPGGFNLLKRNDLDVNYVIVKGADAYLNCTPADKDRWTEMTSAELSNYPGVWSCSALEDVVSNSDSDYVKSGTYSIQITAAEGHTGDLWGDIDLTSNDAYTLSDNNMTLGSGYIKVDDGKAQYLHFEVYVNNAIDLNLRIQYYDNETRYAYISFSLSGAQFNVIDLNLSEIIGNDAWESVNGLRFTFPNAKYSNSDTFYLDKLFFYVKQRYRGVYDATTVTSPVKDYIVVDDNLNTVADCTAMATGLYNALSGTLYEGSLVTSHEFTELRAGDNIAIYVPDRDVSITSTTIQKIEWMPRRQIIHVGRHRSLTEILTETKQAITKRQ